MESWNLGKCCCCEQAGDSVRNAIMLDKKSPVEPGGWGCFVCDLPPLGAVAVFCDDCLEKINAGEAKLKFACLGFPGENRRIEIEKLTEDYSHDMAKHPGETLVEFDEPGGMQDFVQCQNCGLVTAVVDGKCANCGEEICIICGCTESAACPGGCFWTRENVCSQCDAATADQF